MTIRLKRCQIHSAPLPHPQYSPYPTVKALRPHACTLEIHSNGKSFRILQMQSESVSCSLESPVRRKKNL